MRVKRRKKSTRYRGSRMNRRGYKNRTKGSGNRGGFGMSGTGKRGDQRKTLVINLYGKGYFGKDKSISKKHKIPSISLASLEIQLAGLIKKGKAKETKDGIEIDLNGHKIVGNVAKRKMVISVKAASASAKEAVEKAGGKVIEG